MHNYEDEQPEVEPVYAFLRHEHIRNDINSFVSLDQQPYPVLVFWGDKAAEPFAAALYLKLEKQDLDVIHMPRSPNLNAKYQKKYASGRKIIGIYTIEVDQKEYDRFTEVAKKTNSLGVMLISLYPEIKIRVYNGSSDNQESTVKTVCMD